MVERRPALTLLSHLVLVLGVMIVAFPVYLTWVASTQTARDIAQSAPLSLWPGGHGWQTYQLALFGGVGESGVGREGGDWSFEFFCDVKDVVVPKKPFRASFSQR